jgi:two-component system LytT family response regulator
MSHRISAVVIDDEPLARERLRWLIEQSEEMELAAACGDGFSGIEAIRAEKPDVVFLDVQMPGMDGFDVVNAIGVQNMPFTVFVTAYDQHAVRAFDARAIDYLLKPFSDARFEEAVARIRDRITGVKLMSFSTQLASLLQDTPRPSAPELVMEDGVQHLDRIAVRTGDKVRIIPTKTIDWIEAEGVYVKLHVAAETLLLRTQMHALETRLDPRRFVRIHRSTIVNIERVKELREQDKGDYVVMLNDGTRLRLSRSRRRNLETLLGSPL